MGQKQNAPSSSITFWSPSSRAGSRTHGGRQAPGLSWDASAARVAAPEALEGAPQLFLQETTGSRMPAALTVTLAPRTARSRGPDPVRSSATRRST